MSVYSNISTAFRLGSNQDLPIYLYIDNVILDGALKHGNMSYFPRLYPRFENIQVIADGSKFNGSVGIEYGTMFYRGHSFKVYIRLRDHFPVPMQSFAGEE